MLARIDGIPVVNHLQDGTSTHPRTLPVEGWPTAASDSAALSYQPSAVTRSQRLRAIAQLDATARALAAAARRRNGMEPTPGRAH